jgi:hypothetical protein
MSRQASRFPERAVAFALVLAGASASSPVRAQACCAGSGAVTPGRLALHEDGLVGLQAKGAGVLGSFDDRGSFQGSPPGASELDFEEDLFGAARVLDRGQVALLVPFIETRRTSQGIEETGGGVGDVNASVRYDFTLAGASRVVPGIAVLAGLTLPTGTPPDAPNLGVLATGATGIGAWQPTLGVAFEQTWGNWLVSASTFAAQRTARTAGSGASAVHERLGTQWTFLAAVAYVFPNDDALAASLSYTLETEATINGADAQGTAHRLPTLTVSGVLPLSDVWRLQGAVFGNPPVAQLGLNQPAGAGLSATVVRSWI